MTPIDPKYHIEGERIVKTSNGEAIPDEEPKIIFRARDRLVLPMLDYYRRLSQLDGCTAYHLTAIDGRIKAFEEFAQQFPERMKQPGCTKGK